MQCVFWRVGVRKHQKQVARKDPAAQFKNLIQRKFGERSGEGPATEEPGRGVASHSEEKFKKGKNKEGNVLVWQRGGILGL